LFTAPKYLTSIN